MSNIDMMPAAKQALLEAKSAMDGISSDFKVDEEGNFDISKKQLTDYTAAAKEVKSAQAFIDAVETGFAAQEYLDGTEGKSTAATDAARRLAGGMEGKTLADVFMDSAEFKAARERGDSFESVHRITGKMEGKSLHSLSAGTHTFSALGTPQNVGFTEKAMRKTRIRDLFPKSTTKAPVLYGVVETGWVNNAQQVRQRYAADGSYGVEYGENRTWTPGAGIDPASYDPMGDQTNDVNGTGVWGRKPKSKLKMKPVTYPIATIAHTLDAHKNLLDDEPRLRTFINQRMAEGVKYAEDFDLLHSVGGANSEEITGLFHTPNIQRYDGLADDKFSVQIRRAITKAQLAEYDPTGIVISPNRWEEIEVEEDGYGGFRVAVNVAVGAVKQVWHLDVVSTTAMSDANFLLGAFGLGAQIHDREAVTVQMFEQNRDNVENNVVTFRAEERLALEVPRPESFVIGTWTDFVAV